MSYTISLTNGNPLLGTAGLLDGTIDTTTISLNLVGKNYPGYGRFLNENFVHLVENFANSAPPSGALPGQLWWDSGTKTLRVNVATSMGQSSVWKSLAGITSLAIKPDLYDLSRNPTPIAPIVGEFWWDTSNRQLKVYSGLLSQGDTGWITVGPASNTTTGQSGALPDTIVDAGLVSHVVVKFFISNDLVAILSKDATFTPGSTITGWGTSQIRPGFNLAPSLTNSLSYWGNANVAMSLLVGSTVVPSSVFLRSDVLVPSTLPIVTSNVGGLSLGPTSDFTVNITAVASSIGMYNNDNNYDTVMYVKSAGVTTPVIKINGVLGAAQVYNDPTTGLGIATKNYVDSQIVTVSSAYLRRDGTATVTGHLTPAANVTYNLGSATAWFNGIYGKSIQAQYADLAERFSSDKAYAPGTVVELGGSAEITAVKDDLSEVVFGVVSTKAAYLMNAGAGSDETHPAVAISGRVPVNVIGAVRKGDRLVSAGNGLARAANRNEMTPWNVIGRSLTDKLDSGIGTVEATVKLNS